MLDIHAKALLVCDIQPIDVVIQANKHTIPEKGLSGSAPGPGIIFITIDPNSAAFHENIDASFERTFAHELHHAARWDGPGYGETLGEALVSEGLAGYFVIELLGGQPEPWETAVTTPLVEHAKAARESWHSTDYNHYEWFFGTGKLQRWLGYSLGFEIVGRYLNSHPDTKPSSLAHSDAGEFLKYVS